MRLVGLVTIIAAFLLFAVGGNAATKSAALQAKIDAAKAALQ